MRLSILLIPVLAIAGAREDRLAVLRDGLKTALDEVDRQMAGPNPTPTNRDLPNAALAKLVLGQSPREAEKLVLSAYSQQVMDPAAPDYGTIPWQAGHPEIRDANSIEFCGQAIGPMLLHYGGKLSPQFKQEMLPHIRAAIAAIRRHSVKVTYTNIFLMKLVNLILMGEAIGDADSASAGYVALDEWLDWTRQNGIREFDSPTYYSVDLNSLDMGYLYAARPGAREKFRAALDLFWSDMASNFFAPRGSLSGPHSRDYDFLTGIGGIEFYLYQEGIRRTPSTQNASVAKVYLMENESAGGYRPGPEILRRAAIPERVVVSRWEPGNDHDRYNYITPDFAIGSSSANYGPQDKPISIEFAAGEELPVITINPDMSGQPYGKNKFTDRSGHGKPVHLPLNAVSAQEKGALLALLDMDPSRRPETETFATSIILPAQGLTGVPSGEFHKPIEPGSVVGVHIGSAGVAIRVFQMDGADGQTPALSLNADREGLRYGAARLTIDHYRGAAKVIESAHVRLGVLFLADRCSTDADYRALLDRAASVNIRERTNASEWKVTATIGSTRLGLTRDRNSRRLLAREPEHTRTESAPMLLFN